MALSAVIAAVGLALAIGMAAKGMSDQKKARKMAASNIRPTYEINEGEKTNQVLSEDLATRGLADSTKQYYLQNSERGLTASIDAILKGGGDVNAPGQVFGQYNDAIGKLAIADDSQRLQNLGVLLQQNRRMSEQQDKAFQINEYAPFADKAQAAATLAAQGNQWVMSGMQTGMSAISTYGQSYMQNKQINAINNQTAAGLASTPAASTALPTLTSAASNALPTNFTAPPAPAYQGPSSMAFNWNTMTPEQRNLIMGIYGQGFNGLPH